MLVKSDPGKTPDNPAMRQSMLELLIQLHSTAFYHALEVEKLRHDQKVQTDLLDFTSRIANLVEMEQLLSEVATILKESFGYKNVIVGQVDSTRGIIKPFRIITDLEVVLEQDTPPMGVMAWVVHYGELLNVADARKDSRYMEGIKGIRSELAVPVKAGRDQLVGVIDVQAEEVGAFAEADEKLLSAIAVQVASAMQNAQLFALVNRNLEDAKNLLAIQSDMTNQPSFSNMLSSLCQGLTNLIPDSIIVYLTQEKNYFRVEYITDSSPLVIGKIISMPTSLIPRLTLQINPFVVEGKDKKLLAEKLEISIDKEILVIPIHFSDQTLDGLAFVITSGGISPNTLSLVQIIGSISNSILENRLLWERQQLVMHNVTVMSHLSQLALEAVSLEKFIQLMVNFLGKELDFCEVRFYTSNQEGTPRLVSRYQIETCEGLEQILRTELDKEVTNPKEDEIEWQSGERQFKIITIAMKDETVWGYLQAAKEVSDYRLMRDVGIPNLAGILNSIRRRMMSMDKQASMLLELQGSQKMRNEFLAKISHELRTPLTTILAYTDMLTGNVLGELSGEQGHALQSIEKSGRHLFQLINDLLDFSQMERNEAITMDIRPVDMKHAVDESMASLLQFADEKKVTIKSELTDGLPKVMADANRLVQIFSNLISNAVKFTDPGDTVIVRAEAKDDMMHAQVEDHGIGIKPEDQMRVFEAFVQLEDVLHREHGGAGIGLAITQNLVSLMGGEMSLYSEPGKGSIFSFTLPLA
jgi:signal transduction histidine kinase